MIGREGTMNFEKSDEVKLSQRSRTETM